MHGVTNGLKQAQAEPVMVSATRVDTRSAVRRARAQRDPIVVLRLASSVAWSLCRSASGLLSPRVRIAVKRSQRHLDGTSDGINRNCMHSTTA